MRTHFERAGMVVLERGWLSSNNVLFPGGEDHGEAVLVDSGYCSHADQTVALVRAALGGRRLERIVNTHLHSDHCGGNHALQQAFGCEVDVPAGEADKVDRWDEAALTFQATQQRCPRFRRSGTLAAGSALQLGSRVWNVIAAPGHDPQSVVLHEPELQLLISADALWANGFGVVFPELEGESAFDDVRRTLDAIAALPVRTVVPGHGAPFGDVEAALARAYRRLDAFCADPVAHARYAAKVLVKFHLLEVRSVGAAALQGWIAATPYMQTIHARYFDAAPFDDWALALVDDLCRGGALRREGDRVKDA